MREPRSEPPTELGDQRVRRRVGDVDESDVRALAGERAHERRADAGAAAGDEHGASGEIGIARSGSAPRHGSTLLQVLHMIFIT